MPPKIIDKIDKLPTAEAELIGEQIEDLEFSFRYSDQLKLPDMGRRVQVRDIEHTAPVQEAKKYATSYMRGDKLPPIVVTQDDFLVDGATRVAGAQRAKLTHLPAFVINATYEGAPELVRKRIKQLGIALNMKHGRAMRADNIEKLILDVRIPGETARQLATRLHCSETTVQGMFAMQRAEERARDPKVNVDLTGLGTSHKKALGGKVSLTNPVWKALAELSRDARITVADISDISARLRACDDEHGQLEMINAERSSRRDQIRSITSVPSLAGTVKRGITTMMRAEGNPSAAVEWDPAAGADYLRRLDAVIALAERLKAEQVLVERNRTGSPSVTPAFKYGR